MTENEQVNIQLENVYIWLRCMREKSTWNSLRKYWILNELLEHGDNIAVAVVRFHKSMDCLGDWDIVDWQHALCYLYLGGFGDEPKGKQWWCMWAVVRELRRQDRLQNRWLTCRWHCHFRSVPFVVLLQSTDHQDCLQSQVAEWRQHHQVPQPESPSQLKRQFLNLCSLLAFSLVCWGLVLEACLQWHWYRSLAHSGSTGYSD